MIRFHQFIGLLFKVLLVVSSVQVACSVPNDEDQLRLELLRTKYGQKFVFRLEENLYLVAQNQAGENPTIEEAKEIYDLFWFTRNGKGNRRPTTFVYLNILDKNREFRFQLAWDEAKNDYTISDRAYY